MSRRKYLTVAVLLTGFVLVVALLGRQAISYAQSAGERAEQAKGSAGPTSKLVPVVRTAVKFDVSPPLRAMKPIPPQQADMSERPELGPVPVDRGFSADTVVQKLLGPLQMPTPIITFEGVNNRNSVSPPDPNGEVGPNHYVEMVNLSFAVYSKTGTVLYGPVNNNTLWQGFGGPCETRNDGDPVVLYDQLADRWMLTQFTASGPTYYNCVALSTSGDPTGSYYRWAFTTGNNFPDYPKYGMWPDAYYISTREFAGGSTFVGIGAYGLERDQMLIGNPNARVVSFLVPPGSQPYLIGDGLLPSDLDGTTLPPSGSPNFYMGTMDNDASYGAPYDAINLFEFHVDWNNPNNSTFQFITSLQTAPFDSIYPCSGRSCIPQPGTSNRLDILSYRQRPLFRLAYRNFGSYESLVTNQSVEAAPSMAGIRWYEVRSPHNNPVIYQQGTYAPGITDGIHRWMGSIAMDRQGNMAVGYSVSNATDTYPGIRYAGRLVSDPPGQMSQGEAVLINGNGSQTSSQRWGDYTDMTVDPVDDCTFWFVNEYYQTTSGVGWQTRIGAFKFPGCSAQQGTPTPTNTPGGASPTPTRTSTPTPTNTPVSGSPTPTQCPGGTATPIVINGSITTTDPTQTGRLFRDGVPDTCQAAGTCQVFDTTPRHYDNYTFTNTSSNTVCVTVDVNTACTGTNFIFVAGYVGSFDPNNICTNWVADIGSSPDPTGTFSFNVPAGQTLIVNVHEVTANAGCPAYTLTITGLPGGGPCPSPTVTNTPVPPSPTNTAVPPTATNTPSAPSPTPTELVCEMNFSDVPPDYVFYPYIRCLYCRGIIGGYSDGTFRPGNPTTRGQMSKIVANAAGILDPIPPNRQTYTDVPPSHPFWVYIERLSAHGIVGGYSDGTFRPDNWVTRGQLTKFASNAAGFSEPIPPNQQTYTDVPPSQTFWLYIERLSSRGIISGYQCGVPPAGPCDPQNRPWFLPDATITRGQTSKIVSNTFFPVNCAPRSP